MKRMWLRWVLMGLFVVALGFTFVSLGQWQLDRLDQRRDRNANVFTHEQAPVVTFEDAFSHVITEQDQWQRVEVSGETVFFYTQDARPLLQALAARPHLRTLHRPANLEDLFLKLTGRQIREDG